jgi:hypothetical protein
METKQVKAISITPSTWKAIERMAKQDGRSVSGYVDRVLAKHVKEVGA